MDMARAVRVGNRASRWWLMNYDMSLYGDAFWSEVASVKSDYGRLAQVYHDLLSPLVSEKRCVDIGCAAGTVGHFLMQHGWDYEGWDIEAAREHAVRNGVAFAAIDLTDSVPSEFHSAPLMICTEVAEHLPEASAGELVRRLANATKEYLIFSAAVPGQSGTGHINCQPHEYWLERFKFWGLVPDPNLTAKLQQMMRDYNTLHRGYCTNFFVMREK